MTKENRLQDVESLIQESFSWRSIPEILSDSKQLIDFERKEVEFIAEADWNKITARDLENNFEVLSSLTPEAYCYFLPRIITFSLRSEHFDLLLIGSIVNTFGSPTRDLNNLDDFLGPRLRLLTSQELSALVKWFWLISEIPHFENDKERIYQAIEILEMAIGTSSQQRS